MYLLHFKNMFFNVFYLLINVFIIYDFNIIGIEIRA